MSLLFYGHPLSSYCHKVLIALYEHGTPFEYRQLGPDSPQVGQEFAALWPFARMPIVVDGGRMIPESTIIIEYLDLRRRGGTALIPDERAAALEVRAWDRFCDQFVMTPMQQIVADELVGPGERSPRRVADAHRMLDHAYRWLERELGPREWLAGGEFSLADCAAAPALFYAHWVHAIDADHPRLRAYRQRLLARPSYARALDEARPYRTLFPLPIPPGE